MPAAGAISLDWEREQVAFKLKMYPEFARAHTTIGTLVIAMSAGSSRDRKSCCVVCGESVNPTLTARLRVIGMGSCEGWPKCLCTVKAKIIGVLGPCLGCPGCTPLPGLDQWREKSHW